MLDGYSCSRNTRHHSGTSYRSFCVHVRNIIGIVCGIELGVLVYLFIYKFDDTIGSCYVGRSLIKSARHETCKSTLLLSFTIFHAVCDVLTMMSIALEKNKLVLPLLIVLVLNITISLLFLLIALFTYALSAVPYSTIFVLFVLAQAVFRVYEFVCARRLYWYYKWAADQRNLPQCSLLKEEESSFQF
ncbi:unnamed protein product [Bursaphelenchus okinawaensis]|uniref:Uncharacterized protein n=1 Tax=Bursaphelenchus okinawaensis TaxID=465554 RepID=A0A811L956_9BILA|nr:unnamed protein product [Bursaphelenchus okinawaensis]CAG9119769.1 unnamed protein product [Bursaphelenchus okinawaensis]